MTAAELLRMLDADAANLRFALGAGDATKAIEQCADVANMAMMIADVTEIAARKSGFSALRAWPWCRLPCWVS
jgi:hypothetical protein